MGIHELLRSNATMRQTARLRGKWVPVDPSAWKRRNDMDIHIGVGSGGREQELLGVREFTGILRELVTMQGGPMGPVVGPGELYKFADHYADRLGLRNVERFLKDPESPEGQQQMMAQQSKPDPEVEKATQEMQAKQQEFMAKMSLEQQKAFLKAQTDQAKMNMEAQLKVRQQDIEAQLRREDRTSANISDVRFGGRTG